MQKGKQGPEGGRKARRQVDQWTDRGEVDHRPDIDGHRESHWWSVKGNEKQTL